MEEGGGGLGEVHHLEEALADELVAPRELLHAPRVPMQERHPRRALALGACFGGNATMIAAAANVAAMGVLDRTGHRISFVRFLAIGVPVSWIRGRLTALDTYLPLGVFLAMGAAVSHVWRARLIQWYLTTVLGMS